LTIHHINTVQNNNAKSDANFCHQVAGWLSDMLCDLFAKNHKIANNLLTTKDRQK